MSIKPEAFQHRMAFDEVEYKKYFAFDAQLRPDFIQWR